jgi:hypothetical protein
MSSNGTKPATEMLREAEIEELLADACSETGRKIAGRGLRESGGCGSRARCC